MPPGLCILSGGAVPGLLFLHFCLEPYLLNHSEDLFIHSCALLDTNQLQHSMQDTLRIVPYEAEARSTRRSMRRQHHRSFTMRTSSWLTTKTVRRSLLLLALGFVGATGDTAAPTPPGQAHSCTDGTNDGVCAGLTSCIWDWNAGEFM